MAFNINDIIANLKFGGARPTLFQVQLTNPVAPVADVSAPFLIQATSIPEMQLGSIPVPYFGRKINVAGDRTFQPWSVQVINDEDFAIRDALEQWNAAINGLQANIRKLSSSAPAAYKSTGLVSQYDKGGNIIRVYEMEGVWPMQISGIPLSWAQTDTIETFATTFQLDWWQVAGGTTNSGNVN